MENKESRAKNFTLSMMLPIGKNMYRKQTNLRRKHTIMQTYTLEGVIQYLGHLEAHFIPYYGPVLGQDSIV